MLGFVKNIINRSGDKKDNGFYLQLDETGNVVEPTPADKPATSAAGSTAATTETPASEAKTSPKVSVKKPKAETAVKTAEAAPASASAAPKPAAPPAEKNFATKYLVQTNTMSRRRPGANMSGFLEMARQAKVPISK